MKTKKDNQEIFQDYLHADMDDIIFEHRNKSYGGYLLRKLYQSNLTKANMLATVLFLLCISLPLVGKMMKDRLPNDGLTLEKEVTLTEPPPLDTKTPPPPPPPVVEPPARKPTLAFLAPKVIKDNLVQDEETPPDVEELAKIDIGTTTNDGDKNGISAGIEPDGEPAPPAAEVDEGEKPDVIFKVVEQKPEFPDGEAAMLKFIYANIKYPPIARENGIDGLVVVSFVVEKDGSITSINVVRDIGGGCGQESVRVINKMPKWNPGKQRGRPVRVQFNLPVKFKLD